MAAVTRNLQEMPARAAAYLLQSVPNEGYQQDELVGRVMPMRTFALAAHHSNADCWLMIMVHANANWRCVGRDNGPCS